VLVIRRGTENQPLAMVVDLDKVRDGSDLKQDIYLKPSTSSTSENHHQQRESLDRTVPDQDGPRIGFTAATRWAAGSWGRYDEYGHHSGQIANSGVAPGTDMRVVKKQLSRGKM